MASMRLAEAKAKLSELVESAAAGGTARITKRGKPVARIVSAGPPRTPIDFAMLERLANSMPYQAELGRGIETCSPSASTESSFSSSLLRKPPL